MFKVDVGLVLILSCVHPWATWILHFRKSISTKSPDNEWTYQNEWVGNKKLGQITKSWNFRGEKMLSAAWFLRAELATLSRSRSGAQIRDQQSPGEAVRVPSGSSAGVDQTFSRVQMKLSARSYSFGVVVKGSELGVTIVVHPEGWNLEKHCLHIYWTTSILLQILSISAHIPSWLWWPVPWRLYQVSVMNHLLAPHLFESRPEAYLMPQLGTPVAMSRHFSCTAPKIEKFTLRGWG